ncbi:MAG: cysteine protease [Caulobacteraceae bacterium]|nr:cysteine protease [Caulobacteraceae bacterium]
MALSRIATVVGGLLLSKGGRRFAGRHAGKLALATLAWELFQQHRARQTPAAGQAQHQGRTARPSPRPRWRATRTSSR